LDKKGHRVNDIQGAREEITYRSMRPGEEAEISALVAEVFMEFVGCGYPPEGVREFLGYVRPELLSERSRLNHFTLVATRDEEILGMIEVRDFSHVCLFFVKKELHGNGIGRELMKRALAICRSENAALTAVDVNSSPNSVVVYERIGFSRTGPEKAVNGITFVPMILSLKQRD
jgi:GNAT superfamily N-acetyltransferase